MLTSKRLSAVVVILLAALGGGLAQPADSEDIDNLIIQLGADSYQEREEAIRRLIAVGSSALPALRRVADDSRADPDVRLRAARATIAISTVKIEMVRRLGVHNADPKNPNFRRATRVVLSPDGKHAVTTGTDNIRYWDLVNGKQIRVLGAGKRGYRSVAFAPDGRSIAAGGLDNKIYIYDVNTGKILCEMAGHTLHPWSVLFAADGKQVMSGSPDGSIRVWDAAAGKPIRTFKGVGGPIRCLALSPDGKLLAEGRFANKNGLGIVRLWDVEKGTEARALKGHEAESTCVAFSPDGKFLVSTSFDRTVRIWRVSDGKEVKCLKGHMAHVEWAAFTPDGRRVVSCAWDEDPTLRLWDVSSGKQLGASERMTEGLLGLAVLPDGHSALTVGKDGALRLWRWTR